jgi:hypothetical protein
MGLIIFSCEKQAFKKSVLFKGTVIDQTTKLSIEGIKIKLWGSYNGLFDEGSSDLLAQTYSDKNGNFTIDTELILKDYDRYMIGTFDDTASSDTNRISYYYYFNYLSNSYSITYAENLDYIPTELNFMLRPSGVIEFRTSNLQGNKLFDTIIINSPFGIDTVFNFAEIQLSFPPDKTYSFIISNLLNGKIDRTVIKEIYIPNNRSRTTLYSIDIVFDD